ncbi:hypothetical protein ACFWV1_14620 [Streptomyces sp. NPDC058700]|uniref:hypothetical protein n=1 Tax=Streptomyces sp. NPDC058700 TaxID=3346607 RepID=UPI003652D7DB
MGQGALYRVAAGDDGRPTAELVASDGRPTELTYLGTDLRMLDLHADPAKTHLKWRMSRVNADVYLKLTHRRSGETFEPKMHLYRESAGAYTYDDRTFGATRPGNCGCTSARGTAPSPPPDADRRRLGSVHRHRRHR